MIEEDAEWIAYRENFSDTYDGLNYSDSLQARVMRSGHRFVEKDFDGGTTFKRVLEIGAGTGEHLAFVRHGFDEYILSDLDSRTLDIARKKIAETKISGTCGEVKFECQAGESLSYPDNAFDRLIAVHVLEHIYQPHLALKDWRRVLKDGGTLSILIPTDPGFAWRLGRRLGPRRNALAQGIPYDYVMAREHVNSCVNLIALLRHYFPQAKEAWWPLRIPAVDMNLFFAFNAVVSKQESPR